MYQQQAQLPVSHQQVDTSCFNNNLPNNDRVPQIRTPSVLSRFPQLVPYITGLFRMKLQNGANRSPVHVVAYNILAMNGFNNQQYQYWCQRTTDLLAVYMMQAGGNYNDQMLGNVAQEAAQGYLGFIWNQYVQILQQMVDGNTANALQQAVQIWQNMEGKISQAQQPAPMQPSNAYQNNNMMQGHNAFSNVITGGATISHVAGQPVTNVNCGSASEGVYSTMQPIQSFDSSQGTVQTHQSPVVGDYSQPAPMTPTVSQNAPQAPVRTPVYVPVNEIVIDPDHYGNVGYNPNNKYNYIQVNEDTWVIPSILDNNVITREGLYPHPTLYDPKKHIAFDVCYSDGRVLEKIVEITDDMDYLVHELDERMRQRYQGTRVKEGRIVTRSNVIADYEGKSESDATNLGLRMNLCKDPLELAKGLPMLIISDVNFTGGTDMENEKSVVDYIKEQVSCDNGVIPTHEYCSERHYQLDIDENGYKIIDSLSNCFDYASVGSMLKEALRVGNLNLRTYNFLDQRLTDTVNEFIKDSLSNDEVRIDSFVSDIMELLEYFESSSVKVYDAFLDGLKKVISRAVSINATDDGYYIYDEFINIQTHWLFGDLTMLDLQKGECVMISARTNVTLTEVLRETIKRNSKDSPYARYRLITTDGIYLEMVKGHLMDNVNMLKRV